MGASTGTSGDMRADGRADEFEGIRFHLPEVENILAYLGIFQPNFDPRGYRKGSGNRGDVR